MRSREMAGKGATILWIAMCCGGVALLGAWGAWALRAHAARAALAAAKASFAESAAAPRRIADADPVWRLGRSLFFDPALSRSGAIACATCHTPDHAWSDGRAHAAGDAGKMLAMRTPTLFGDASLHRFGWSGRFRDTAAVVTFAITSPGNMAQPLAAAATRLRGSPASIAAFHEAFGSEPEGDTLVKALIVFVNSIQAVDAPFDRWIGGADDAVTEQAKRGFALFVGKAGCATCHAGPTFTDGSFHDIGSSTTDRGRGNLFKTSPKLQYAFKTPSLRGVADRAPYMHDGSLATLDEVVALYDRGGIERPSRAEEIKPLHLSTGEKADLVTFLGTLSGGTRFATP